MLTWKNYNYLPSNENIKIKFYLENTHIYSFWISNNINGCSNGFIGNGGPAYESYKDTNDILYKFNNITYGKIQYILTKNNNKNMIIKDININHIIELIGNIYVENNNFIQKMKSKDNKIYNYLLEAYNSTVVIKNIRLII